MEMHRTNESWGNPLPIQSNYAESHPANTPDVLAQPGSKREKRHN